MIEISEKDFLEFSATMDTMCYNCGIETRINPLVMWDILIEEVDKIKDGFRDDFNKGL